MSTVETSEASTEPVQVFAALGDRTRLHLVDRLSDGRARSIADLTEGAAITRQAVTKHLRVLERAGVVEAERVGRESRFVLRPAPIRQESSSIVMIPIDY